MYALSTPIRSFLVVEPFTSEESSKEKREGPFPSLPNPLSFFSTSPSLSTPAAIAFSGYGISLIWSLGSGF